MDKKVLTQEGLNNLKAELEDLKTNKRKEVAERIKIAKEYGDLSENAEYQEAKDQQGYVEGRILELEALIKTAILADKQVNDHNIVGIGSHVAVQRDGQTLNFTIVGSTEADPANKKISLESPLGQALLNKKIGDEVEVKLPGGIAIYKILDIK